MRISLDRKLEWGLSEIFGKRKKRERKKGTVGKMNTKSSVVNAWELF